MADWRQKLALSSLAAVGSIGSGITSFCLYSYVTSGCTQGFDGKLYYLTTSGKHIYAISGIIGLVAAYKLALISLDKLDSALDEIEIEVENEQEDE